MSLEEAARSLLNAVEDSGHKADVMAACNALRAALAEAQADAEPVAWHICDNIGALVTDDRKEASAARECGHTVRQLVFREPRRESAESAELSDDTLVSLWNAAKASTLVNTWHNDQHKIAELRAVLRAAGGEE
jgi:phosphopantothenate synthetase